MWLPIVCVILAYLLGSVPFGYLVARARGVDILKLGSGNIGATNVGRILGRKFGVLVFALDFLKGALPTAIVQAVTGDSNWAVAAGLAAVVGHMFPIFLRLRGGKGVATGFGVVAVLMPAATAVAFLVWLAILSATRYMSLASVFGAFVLAGTRLMTTAAPFAADEHIVTAFAIVIALLVVVRHRANLGRLMQGNERQVSDSARLTMLARVLHILALGLWCGGGVFFSFVVTPSIFATVHALDSEPPEWLKSPNFGEHSMQLAARMVGPMLLAYYHFQEFCAIIAIGTAAAWYKLGGVHRLRLGILAAALTLAFAGHMVSYQVSSLRVARYDPNPAIAEAAKPQFARWHTVSILLNISALAFACGGLALAAALPDRAPRVADEHSSL